jgi:PAS domain S-box-containing protein
MPASKKNRVSKHAQSAVPSPMIPVDNREAKLNKIFIDCVSQFRSHQDSEKSFFELFPSFLERYRGASGASGLALYRTSPTEAALIASDGFEGAARLQNAMSDAARFQDILTGKKIHYWNEGELQSLPPQKRNGRSGTGLVAVHIPVLKDGQLFAALEMIHVDSLIAGTLRKREYNILCDQLSLLADTCADRSAKLLQKIPYRSIVEHASDGMTVVKNGKFIFTNTAFASIFGYSSEHELIGKPIATIVAKEDKFRVTERSKMREDGTQVPSRYEYRGLKKNGEIIDIEVVATLFSLNHDTVSLAIHRDVTLRKNREYELQESEQMFRNIIDGILTVGDALVVTDLEGKVLRVNDEFERMTGLQKESAIGQGFPYAWLIEDEMARYMIWISTLREKRSLRDFDIHWKNTSGNIISVSINTTLLNNAFGHPVAMMNMARDITSRKRLEEENRLQLERLRVLYELSRTLTSLLQIEEICEEVMRYLRQVLSFDAFFIDLYNESDNTVNSAVNYDTVSNEFQRVPPVSVHAPLKSSSGDAKVIESRRPFVEHRLPDDQLPPTFPFGDTARRSLSRIFTPMFSKDKIIGILSIQSYAAFQYDDTHVRLLESFANLAAIALEKAQLYQETISTSRQLQSRNKELDDFTYVVSHDLKEPLITVEGYSKILAKEYGPSLKGAGEEYVDLIIQSCVRMKSLVDDLLVLSRVSRLTEVTEEISLKTIVTEVMDDLKFSLQEKMIDVILPDRYPTYRCNATQLKLVFRNLISNAIKFTSNDKPRIAIKITEDKNEIHCSVEDNGLGIDKKYFDKIFVIFQRLHPQEAYEGSGAGLAIVKKIVELYHGKIWLESEVGKGSTFHFSLPKYHS